MPDTRRYEEHQQRDTNSGTRIVTLSPPRRRWCQCLEHAQGQSPVHPLPSEEGKVIVKLIVKVCKVGAEVQICKGVGAEVRGSAEVFVQVICSRYEEEMKTCIVGAE